MSLTEELKNNEFPDNSLELFREYVFGHQFSSTNEKVCAVALFDQFLTAYNDPIEQEKEDVLPEFEQDGTFINKRHL